jgi:pimeloyl-ACP methyl ester carboxylesterase
MSEVVTLPDGRRLGYAVYGDPGGAPVWVFHGTPGSRVGGRLLAAAATERGVRVIAPDRPGHGLSTFRTGRRIGDWPADVAALAGALDLGQFGVVGLSGCGPYALACAAAIPDRLSGTALVSAVPAPEFRPRGAVERLLADGFGRAPWLARPPLAVAGWLASEHPTSFGRLVRRGVRPDDVTVPVAVHHGTADRSVALEGAQAMADAIPNVTLSVHEGEGHLSTFLRNAGPVLDAAAGAVDG